MEDSMEELLKVATDIEKKAVITSTIKMQIGGMLKELNEIRKDPEDRAIRSLKRGYEILLNSLEELKAAGIECSDRTTTEIGREYIMVEEEPNRVDKFESLLKRTQKAIKDMNIPVIPDRIKGMYIPLWSNLTGVKIEYDCGNCKHTRYARIPIRNDPVVKCDTCGTSNLIPSRSR